MLPICALVGAKLFEVKVSTSPSFHIMTIWLWIVVASPCIHVHIYDEDPSLVSLDKDFMVVKCLTQ